MAYLRARDYELRIQAAMLLQYTANATINKRLAAEQEALAKIKSYLVQKYDVAKEFTDTTVFNRTLTYNAEALVELDATAYVPATAYVVNNMVSSAGLVYICIQNGTGQTPASSPLFWTLIGTQYDLYYAKLPKEEYNYKTPYEIGDEVFYKNKVYTAVKASTGIFPDDATDGLTTWGAGVAYSVAAGVLPSDAAFWANGDNRCAQLVYCMIDLAIYAMSPSIAARNSPDIRDDRYNEAIDWLIKASREEITADIPLLQPHQGQRTRYGYRAKNVNSY